MKSHLFYQRRDPQRSVDLLQPIEVFEGGVELRHEDPLVHRDPLPRAVAPTPQQQVLLGGRVHRPANRGGRGRYLNH